MSAGIERFGTGAGPYPSNYYDRNSVKILSEVIIVLLAFLESKWKKTRKNHPVDPNEKEEKAENNMVHRRGSNRRATASLGCKSDVAGRGSTSDDRVATTDSTYPS